jgi:non-homologous end joining protein Ku
VEGKEFTEEPEQAPKTQIIDLMEALKASLKSGKGGAEKKAAAPKRKVGGARS